ncbi:MAG: DUF4339 domain-containing protein [Segetibacter sp.]
MEIYSFIERGGTKQGPFKLSELLQKAVDYDNLVWRSDSDQWKKASEYVELKDILIIQPSPTPKEQKVREVNEKFIKKIIGQIAIIYVVSSILVAGFSFFIAQSSWETYLKDTGGKYLGNKSNNGYSAGMPYSGASSPTISFPELQANKRYASYEPGVNNETISGNGQAFFLGLFKPFSQPFI